jgi:hypothetical protein
MQGCKRCRRFCVHRGISRCKPKSHNRIQFPLRHGSFPNLLFFFFPPSLNFSASLYASSMASPTFLFLSLPVLTLTVMLFDPPCLAALRIWRSASSQSAAPAPIAYLTTGGKWVFRSNVFNITGELTCLEGEHRSMPWPAPSLPAKLHHHLLEALHQDPSLMA